MVSKRIKHTLSLSKIIDDKILEIAEEEDITFPEVIRNALALFVYVKRDINSGSKLQLIDKNGKAKEIAFEL